MGTKQMCVSERDGAIGPGNGGRRRGGVSEEVWSGDDRDGVMERGGGCKIKEDAQSE